MLLFIRQDCLHGVHSETQVFPLLYSYTMINNTMHLEPSALGRVGQNVEEEKACLPLQMTQATTPPDSPCSQQVRFPPHSLSFNHRSSAGCSWHWLPSSNLEAPHPPTCQLPARRPAPHEWSLPIHLLYSHSLSLALINGLASSSPTHGLPAPSNPTLHLLLVFSL